jgi:hypothetical protein
MADRLTHKNLLSNPHAAYLFVEEGARYRGKRLCLRRIKEERNSPMVGALRRRCPARSKKGLTAAFLVYFRVERILPLVGAGVDT